MDEIIYVILKLLFDFALEVWFRIDLHGVKNICAYCVLKDACIF